MPIATEESCAGRALSRSLPGWCTRPAPTAGVIQMSPKRKAEARRREEQSSRRGYTPDAVSGGDCQDLARRREPQCRAGLVQ
jgi:hypothetical protein